MSLTFWKRPASLTNRDSEDVFYSLQNDINRIFEDFVGGRERPVAQNSHQRHMIPRVSVKETADEYVVTAELPGFEKKDIQISINNNVLSLKGERRSEEQKGNEKYHVNEFSYGSFERSFMLPEGHVDEEKVAAKFENGILKINLGKQVAAKRDVRKVDVQ